MFQMKIEDFFLHYSAKNSEMRYETSCWKVEFYPPLLLCCLIWWFFTIQTISHVPKERERRRASCARTEKTWNLIKIRYFVVLSVYGNIWNGEKLKWDEREWETQLLCRVWWNIVQLTIASATNKFTQNPLDVVFELDRSLNYCNISIGSSGLLQMHFRYFMRLPSFVRLGKFSLTHD